MSCATILARLKSLANPANVERMARYGIRAVGVLGASMPALPAIARRNKCARHTYPMRFSR